MTAGPNLGLADKPLPAIGMCTGAGHKHDESTGPRLFCHGFYDLKRAEDGHVSDRAGNLPATSGMIKTVKANRPFGDTGDLPAVMTGTNRPFDTALDTGHVGAGFLDRGGHHQAHGVAA